MKPSKKKKQQARKSSKKTKGLKTPFLDADFIKRFHDDQIALILGRAVLTIIKQLPTKPAPRDQATQENSTGPEKPN